MKHMFHIINNIELEIILVLLRGKSHLREISRDTKRSPATIFRKLNEMAKNNIVDYKSEGKNNVYFIKNNLLAKKVVYEAENYKLIKLLHKYPDLSVILNEVLTKEKSDIIILFGSYANFTTNKESDIDIYIETNNVKVKNEMKNIHSKINTKIGDFDINSPLIKEIVKNHIILRGTEKYYEKSKVLQ
jgi:predicted nucleotidyltransferase